MAPTTIRMAIVETLEDLEKENLDKFRHQLIHRGGEPRVRRNKVDGRSILEVTDAMVNAFTEEGVFDVVVEILNQIDCREDAKALVNKTQSLRSSTSNNSSSSAAGASGGAAAGPAAAGVKHFIDKHRLKLINRVTNVDPVLDELLDRDVIDQGVYDKIRAKPTTQVMMRDIYDGPMRGGKACKDILYEILEQHEKFLLDELKNA